MFRCIPAQGVLALILALLLAPAHGQPPTVAVSLKPLHSLVSAVTEGVTEPVLLVSGGDSPHGFQLRPSKARALRRADLIVWVGPELETFLEKPIAALGGNERRILRLGGASGMRLLAARTGGVWEAGHRDHEWAGDADRSDGHIWLSPDNARRTVALVAEALARLDPVRAETYRDNAAAAKARIRALDEELARRLAPVAERPYVVFHDAYQYLEVAYGLNARGAVTVAPDRPPGARRLRELRRQIEALDAVCVFSEPQFEPALVRTIVAGTGARTGELDPLGAELEAGPDLYFELMRANARALVECLGAGDNVN